MSAKQITGKRTRQSLRHLFRSMMLPVIAACIFPAQSVQAQNQSDAEAKAWEKRASVAIIDDATFYQNLRVPTAEVLNQTLVEPQFALRYRNSWTISTSLVGLESTREAAPIDAENSTDSQMRVRELFGKYSTGDFELTVGRKLVRWGTGYAFTAAGVLDPPIMPANPTDRLGVNVGRDLVKLDFTRSTNSLSVAWTTAAFSQADANLHEAGAIRYNALIHGFDTSAIVYGQSGGEIEGGLTWTRVFGNSWEFHGEAMWQDHPTFLMGGKYTLPNGIDLIAEYFTPSPTFQLGANSRQQDVFLYAGKHRLRELPGWNKWNVAASGVANLADGSSITIIDISRGFGDHFTAYTHIELPRGSSTSLYGASPYSVAPSFGVRFQL